MNDQLIADEGIDVHHVRMEWVGSRHSRGQHRAPRIRYSPPLPLFIAFWAAVDVMAGLGAAFVWIRVITQ